MPSIDNSEGRRAPSFRHMHMRQLGASALAMGLALAVMPACASDDWFSQSTMTGDWNGARTALKDAGITPTIGVLNEYARNMSGGMRRGGGVAQQYYLWLDLDMGKLAGWHGGYIHFRLNDRSGPNTSARNTGNKLQVQSNYGAGQNLRLSELAYEQRFKNDKYILKVGFLPEGDDFNNMVVPLCAFQNFSFCGHANPIFFNSGSSVYPTGHWGGDLRAWVRPDFYVEGGAYAVNMEYLRPNHGFDVSLDSADGVSIPLELGWQPKFGENKLSGDYKLGGYYETTTVNDIAHPAVRRHGRYGAYLMANQRLISFQPGTKRGLIAFAEYIVGDTRTSLIPSFWNFGFIVTGPWSARPNDYITLGVGHANVNDRARKTSLQNTLNGLIQKRLDNLIGQTLDAYGQHGETDWELGYGLKLAPWLTINPNIQYIEHPGAFSHKSYSDAWVLGTQLMITF